MAGSGESPLSPAFVLGTKNLKCSMILLALMLVLSFQSHLLGFHLFLVNFACIDTIFVHFILVRLSIQGCLFRAILVLLFVASLILLMVFGDHLMA